MTDLPTCLTAEQRFELTAELRDLQRRLETHKKEAAWLQTKARGLEAQRDRTSERLRLHRAAIDAAATATAAAGSATAAVTSSSSSPAAAANADAGDDAVPRWKRNRQQREAESSAAAQPLPSSSAAAVGSAGRPAATGGRPQLLAKGAAFGLLQGALRTAVKDNAASDGVLKQRMAAQAEAQMKIDLESMADVTTEYESATHYSGVHQRAVAVLSADVEELETVVRAMKPAEESYNESHFLRAEGLHYDVCFVPAAHTEHSKAMLDEQLLHAATRYLETFRRGADEQLRKIAARRQQRAAAAAASTAAGSGGADEHHGMMGNGGGAGPDADAPHTVSVA